MIMDLNFIANQLRHLFSALTKTFFLYLCRFRYILQHTGNRNRKPLQPYRIPLPQPPCRSSQPILPLLSRRGGARTTEHTHTPIRDTPKLASALYVPNGARNTAVQQHAHDGPICTLLLPRTSAVHDSHPCISPNKARGNCTSKWLPSVQIPRSADRTIDRARIIVALRK